MIHGSWTYRQRQRKTMKIEVYPTDSGQYGWRLKSRNGKAMALSPETYVRKGSAHRAAKNFAELLKSEPPVVDYEERTSD